jgi:hypothetical protein
VKEGVGAIVTSKMVVFTVPCAVKAGVGTDVLLPASGDIVEQWGCIQGISENTVAIPTGEKVGVGFIILSFAFTQIMKKGIALFGRFRVFSKIPGREEKRIRVESAEDPATNVVAEKTFRRCGAVAELATVKVGIKKRGLFEQQFKLLLLCVEGCFARGIDKLEESFGEASCRKSA